MRSRPDAGLRSVVRERLRHVGQWVTIETGDVEQGVPDANVITRPRGLETWIEYKATDGWAVKVRAAQVGWILTRWRYGGRVLIFVRRKRTDGTDELRVIDGQYVRELASEGLRGAPHVFPVMGGGPGQWDWSKIETLLRGG